MWFTFRLINFFFASDKSSGKKMLPIGNKSASPKTVITLKIIIPMVGSSGPNIGDNRVITINSLTPIPPGAPGITNMPNQVIVNKAITYRRLYPFLAEYEIQKILRVPFHRRSLRVTKLVLTTSLNFPY